MTGKDSWRSDHLPSRKRGTKKRLQQVKSVAHTELELTFMFLMLLKAFQLLIPWYHIIYHLFSFRRSIQGYKIHMDMEIVTFLGIKKWKQHKCTTNTWSSAVLGFSRIQIIEYHKYNKIANIKNISIETVNLFPAGCKYSLLAFPFV